MKKTCLLLICICMIFTFVACNSNSESQMSGNNQTSESIINTEPSDDIQDKPEETTPTEPIVIVPDGELLYTADIFNEKLTLIQNLAHASIFKRLEGIQKHTQYLQADPVAMSMIDIVANGEWIKMTSLISLNSKVISVAKNIPDGEISAHIDWSVDSPYHTFLIVKTDTELIMYDSSGKRMFTIPFEKENDFFVYSLWPTTYETVDSEFYDAYKIKILHKNEDKYSATTYSLKINNGRHSLDFNGYAWGVDETYDIEAVLLDKNGIKIGDVKGVASYKSASVGDYIFVYTDELGLVQATPRENGFVINSSSVLPKLDDGVAVDNIFYINASEAIFSIRGEDKHVFSIWDSNNKDIDTIGCFILPDKHTVAQITRVSSGDGEFVFQFDNGDVYITNGALGASFEMEDSEYTHAMIKMVKLKNTSYINKNSFVESISLMDGRLWILMGDGQVYGSSLSELPYSNIELTTKDDKYNIN